MAHASLLLIISDMARRSLLGIFIATCMTCQQGIITTTTGHLDVGVVCSQGDKEQSIAERFGTESLVVLGSWTGKRYVVYEAVITRHLKTWGDQIVCFGMCASELEPQKQVSLGTPELTKAAPARPRTPTTGRPEP